MINKSWWIDLLLIGFVTSAFFLLFLGSYPLHLPDEGRYAEVAREMLANHNLISPTLNGVSFFDKPPLYYWLTVMTMHFHGVSELSARLGPALLGVFGILGIYITGRKLGGRQIAWFAAGLCATSPLYFLGAHFANCDLIMAVCLSLSMFSFLIGIESPSRQQQRLAFLSAYAWSGIAILAKGLIGIVFPIGIIGLYILCFNQWALLKRMMLLPGLLLIAVIALPWFILVSHANSDFLHYFFYIQHFQRFIGTTFNNRAPFWFYIPVVFIGFWPWSLWLFSAIAHGFKQSFIKKSQRIDGFLLLWSLLVLVFFSIPHSKTIGYILPLFPPLALLLARYLSHLRYTMGKITVSIWLTTQLLFGLVLMIGPHYLTRYQLPLLLTTGLGIGLIILTLLVYVWHKRGHALIPAMIVNQAFLLLGLLSLASFVPSISTKPIATWLKDHAVSHSAIYAYNIYPFDLPFYLQQPIHVVVNNWHDPLLAIQDTWQGEFAYSIQYQSGPQKNFVNTANFLKVWHTHQPIYVIVNKRHLDVFEADIGHQPINIVMKTQKLWLVTQE